ncbi:(4Fe-4S)-binding protein [Streptomyces sp. NPDC094048]|uniref:(4Fe-4S)-binding protein n=1 Tax=Streptomyces sp. NPDC094048 TaxID=3155207 RepID=UPI0033332910
MITHISAIRDPESPVPSWFEWRAGWSRGCVRGLPSVFDTARKPWMQPANAPADDIADVIRRCPSGALQYHRTSGTSDGVPEVPTHVSLHVDGVLHLRPDLEVVTPQGARQETRVMLCGCGRTGNAPYCDRSGVCGEHG